MSVMDSWLTLAIVFAFFVGLASGYLWCVQKFATFLHKPMPKVRHPHSDEEIRRRLNAYTETGRRMN